MAELHGDSLARRTLCCRPRARGRGVGRRGGGVRDRRRLRGTRGGARRRASAAAGAGRRARRHLEHVRRALLPRRGYGGAAGHRPRRQRRRDVRLPGRRLARPGAPQDPGLLRRVGRALRLAGGAGVRVRTFLLPRQGGHPARDRGPDVHRQREGLAVRRHGDAGPARAQGTGPGRHRGHQAGHGPAAFATWRKPASRSGTRPERPIWWRTRLVRSWGWPGGGSRRPGWSAPARSCLRQAAS